MAIDHEKHLIVTKAVFYQNYFPGETVTVAPKMSQHQKRYPPDIFGTCIGIKCGRNSVKFGELLSSSMTQCLQFKNAFKQDICNNFDSP